MTPLRLFRTVAVAEAITWALLLLGMFLKYVTETTELGVQIFGMVHGVVFVAYCVTAVVVAIDRRWSIGHTLLGLVAAVPPFATLLFDWYAERRGLLARTWRLADVSSQRATPLDVPVGWLVRNPVAGAAAGAMLVAALTGLALTLGPPA